MAILNNLCFSETWAIPIKSWKEKKRSLKNEWATWSWSSKVDPERIPKSCKLGIKRWMMETSSLWPARKDPEMDRVKAFRSSCSTRRSWCVFVIIIQAKDWEGSGSFRGSFRVTRPPDQVNNHNPLADQIRVWMDPFRLQIIRNFGIEAVHRPSMKSTLT